MPKKGSFLDPFLDPQRGQKDDVWASKMPERGQKRGSKKGRKTGFGPPTPGFAHFSRPRLEKPENNHPFFQRFPVLALKRACFGQKGSKNPFFDPFFGHFWVTFLATFLCISVRKRPILGQKRTPFLDHFLAQNGGFVSCGITHP